MLVFLLLLEELVRFSSSSTYFPPLVLLFFYSRVKARGNFVNLGLLASLLQKNFFTVIIENNILRSENNIIFQGNLNNIF